MNPRLLGAALVIGTVSVGASPIDPFPKPPSSVSDPGPASAGSLASRIVRTPLIQAGHPSPGPGITPDAPDFRIDPNTTTSPFAGVGSIFADDDPSDPLGFMGSAVAISPWRILTAAHCIDVLGSDGRADVRPENILFVLNYGRDLSHVIPAASFWLHPDFGGAAESANDDLAVIQLSSPLPEGVPIYPLADPSWGRDVVLLAGYGRSGDGLNGDYIDSSFSTKRIGANVVELELPDDEGGPENEVMMWDFEFEGDPERYDVFGIPETTLPNGIETTLGDGDSGGPAFMRNPNDPNDLTLYVTGVNTFSFWIPGVEDHDDPSKFGGGSGGTILNASYQGWINSVPDVSTWFVEGTLAGLALMSARSWRRF